MDKRLKRILIIAFMLFTLILGTVMYTVLSGEFKWDSIIVVIVVVLFLLYAIPRFILNKDDIVENDEYSKKVMQTAASRTFYISLYVWLFLMYFDDLMPATSTQIGLGISISAVIFIINAFIIKFTGLKE